VRSRNIFIVLIILALLFGVYFWMKGPKDACINKDREYNNCVPAGKCSPFPSVDEIIDCDVKNYDSKYRPSV
jgi:hypothetical protein